MILQDLNLKVGEKATCVAGYPHKQTVTVICIKDFDSCKFDNYDNIIDNPDKYISYSSSILTSHFISGNWNKK